jgi:stage II sporulation protein M
MPSHESFLYLKELRPYLIASLLLIGTGIIFGVLSVLYFPGIAEPVSGLVGEFVKTFLALPPFYLALAIFFNNAFKTLLAIFLGIFAGVVPAFFLLANGCAIGIVFYLSVQSRGVWASLLAIVPHGLFELPAVLLGTSIGLLLGVHATKRIFGKTETTLGAQLGRALKFFLVVIVPILLLAAFIEAFITAALVSKS